ncbi:MAG TPA: histidine phosphotransferase family protein [Stellaceae bacterium]|nr:histidine phosphotransferase family protein [Stellaceae bacterium]
MPSSIDLRILELLAARLCHDLAGPVAAIGNGAELLGDDDPDFARDAAALIGESARTAAKRLQMFRYVYGWSPGAMAGPPPRLLAAEYFAGTRIECDYPEAVGELASEWQRLACNLLIIAAEALPRGGQVALAATAGGIGLELQVKGEGAGLSPQNLGALTGTTAFDALTSREVGAYFAGMLAAGLGQRLRVTAESGGFHISCEALG